MIEAKGLTKYYGSFPAIENVSFTINRGEVVGFLGPNAAGKTTTMRILTGFMPPTSGSATVAGYDVLTQSLEMRKHIGYLPESVPLYLDETVSGYLNYMGALRGMDANARKKRIADVVEICRLEDYVDTHIGKLSKGYRQRVGIAQAILHEPDVLIMDEPTIGIDPIQVVETRKLIRDLGKEHTLILSTHILPEASVVCQRVLIIHEGQIVAEDKPENLAERLQGMQRIDVEVRGPRSDVAQALRNIKGIQKLSWTGEGDQIVYTMEARLGSDLRAEVARTVVQRGWSLLRLVPVSMSLEEIFLRLTVQEESP
jgi:ABC-2 type transport system ATP-binding protein